MTTPTADSAAEGDLDGCRTTIRVLDQVANKWTIMIVASLAHGPVRFNALQRRIPGVSHQMLTLTLRNLERSGLVARKAFAVIPPRVDYTLTPLGRSLIPPLAALREWAIANDGSMTTSQDAFDSRIKGIDPAEES